MGPVKLGVSKIKRPGFNGTVVVMRFTVVLCSWSHHCVQ